MRRYVLAMMVLFSLQGCCAERSKSVEKEARAEVEVLYFHGKQRCVTCRTVEMVVDDLMKNELSEAVRNGRVRYRVVDMEDDVLLADRYKVSWSSLIVDKDGVVYDLTEEAFRFARSNPNRLKGIMLDTIGR